MPENFLQRFLQSRCVGGWGVPPQWHFACPGVFILPVVLKDTCPGVECWVTLFVQRFKRCCRLMVCAVLDDVSLLDPNSVPLCAVCLLYSLASALVFGSLMCVVCMLFTFSLGLLSLLFWCICGFHQIWKIWVIISSVFSCPSLFPRASVASRCPTARRCSLTSVPSPFSLCVSFHSFYCSVVKFVLFLMDPRIRCWERGVCCSHL